MIRRPPRSTLLPYTPLFRSLLARGGREGQQGVPVIGRVERDDTMLAGLAGLDPVLPGELQGGLDRFRAAGEEIELVELARERGGELAGELLHRAVGERGGRDVAELARLARQRLDRKSTRLNSSHSQISYAVFCLKKKKVALWVFYRATSYRAGLAS